jgi:hypothetical protein
MICKLCWGAGRFTILQWGQREQWDCIACYGAGVRILYSHPYVNNRAKAFKARGGGA